MQRRLIILVTKKVVLWGKLKPVKEKIDSNLCFLDVPENIVDVCAGKDFVILLGGSILTVHFLTFILQLPVLCIALETVPTVA